MVAVPDKLILMAKIRFLSPSGDETEIEATSGTLMEHAVEEGVDGIYGDCGGVCSCATCHVQVHPDWVDRVGPPDEAEKDILDLEDGANERSRLSCQIAVREELDGLIVKVVES